MKFCKMCDNMYYISIDPKNSNQLSHYCRSCGYVDEEFQETGTCVLNTQLKKTGTQRFNQIIGPYTKLDVTLPRLKTVPCPNAECLTNSDDENKRVPRDVLYVRYNDDEMKYLFLCSTCDTTWNN